MTVEGSGGGGIVFALLRIEEDGWEESGKEPLVELMKPDGAWHWLDFGMVIRGVSGGATKVLS